MTTRRWIALIALITTFALTVDWSPNIPPFPLDAVSQARAQIPMISQGIVHATVASVNAANTTSEVLLYQYPIPGALLATWTAANRAQGSAPLHLRLSGGLKTLGTVGGITGNSLSVNLGGSSATMMVVNGAALPPDIGSGSNCGAGAAVGAGACQAPVYLDVVISPIATVTTQNCTDLRPCSVSVFMAGRFVTASTTQAVANFQFSTETAYNAATIATLNLNQATTNLNVVWRWGSAASGNSLNIYNGVLKLGF